MSSNLNLEWQFKPRFCDSQVAATAKNEKWKWHPTTNRVSIWLVLVKRCVFRHNEESQYGWIWWKGVYSDIMMMMMLEDNWRDTSEQTVNGNELFAAMGTETFPLCAIAESNQEMNAVAVWMIAECEEEAKSCALAVQWSGNVLAMGLISALSDVRKVERRRRSTDTSR